MSSWELPESVTVNGVQYAIYSDFRDILGVIQALENVDYPDIERAFIALNLFYRDFHAIPQSDTEEALRQMMLFLNCGQTEDEQAPVIKRLDWEQDQQMIAADVNKVAGREIRALPHLHWWTFIGYFSAVGEGRLSTVVSIRDKLRRGKKLEAWEREYYRDNKAQVDLRQAYTAEELAEQERLKKLLGE